VVFFGIYDQGSRLGVQPKVALYRVGLCVALACAPVSAFLTCVARPLAPAMEFAGLAFMADDSYLDLTLR
jgi:hypothetical protein